MLSPLCKCRVICVETTRHAETLPNAEKENEEKRKKKEEDEEEEQLCFQVKNNTVDEMTMEA